MRVNIVKTPNGAIGGIWLSHLQVGQVYNLAKEIAEALIIQGFAIEERRWGERRKINRPESGRRQSDRSRS